MEKKPIVILDFGSQFAHLIGNRVRRLGAWSELVPTDTPAEEIKAMNPAGIILSGGPQSVFESDSPRPDEAVFDIDVPVMGICYGHQLLVHHYGGRIESGHKEFGKAELNLRRIENESERYSVPELGAERPLSGTSSFGRLFDSISETSIVWMNHGDSVMELPEGFSITGSTKDCPIAAYENLEKNIYSVQFHPEVTHSEEGMKILGNFVKICGAENTWNIAEVTKNLLSTIKEQVGERNVFLMVSGGVDSSVAFALLNKALGEERVYGLFVDHGMLRKDEGKQVMEMMGEAGFYNLHIADESEYFLNKLEGITEPEAKRKAIGDAFLDVQKKVAKNLKLDSEKWLLGQGTIYPDHIETGGSKHASKIKTHHNRVPEIEKLIKEGRIVEPLADFYKDEVRDIGREIGLPEGMVVRHPFPGPGLGVRILCQDKTAPLEGREEMEMNIRSAFDIGADILPVKSVGVQGDARSYRHPVVIFSPDVAKNHVDLATKIPNAFPEVNRVIYCLSQPAVPSRFYPTLPAEMTRDRIAILHEADAVVRKILTEENLMDAVWQFPVVLLPFGMREGTESIILRPIQSENAMTATAVVFEEKILRRMSEEIMEHVPQISAVMLDMTSKPPGTIEWE